MTSFVRNEWYVAAWDHEVTRQPLARTYMGEPVMLYRTENGTAVALEDRCCHRLLPLSMGTVKGDFIECGYHGLTFDGSGKCVRIPGQASIPPQARVRAYPTAEKLGMVWLWLGDPALADARKIFDRLPQWGQPNWGLNEGPYTYIKANYQHMTDNLVDPAHISFVHKTTIGSAASEDIPVSTTQDGDLVIVSRWTENAEPVPFFKRFGGFKGNVDRWQYYYLYAPAIAIIDFGSHAVATGRNDAARERGMRVYSCHFMTPETETSTHYFWLQLRNFAPTDETVSRQITEQFVVAFSEDKAILEAVQRRESEGGKLLRVKLAIDNGSTRLRRVVERRVAAEAGAEAKRHAAE